MIKRFLLLSAGCAAAALGLADPASAHIDPDPKEAQAGSTQSIAFTVEHGCDGSPTIQLDMRLPDGVTQASPDDVDGWEGSIEENVITFVGGPLPDDEEGTFAVTLTLPPTPDTTIYFPFVQRCEVGEIRWIGIPAEPGDELDEPAPALSLLGPVASTTAPATTVAPTTTIETVTTTPVESSIVPPPTSVDETTVPATTEAGVATDDDSSPNTGTWFFVASVLAVFGLGTFVAFRARSARRRRDASSSAAPPAQ